MPEQWCNRVILWPIRQMRKSIILIIIQESSSFTEILILVYLRQNIRRFFRRAYLPKARGIRLVKKESELSAQNRTYLADSTADLAERNEICGIFSGKKI